MKQKMVDEKTIAERYGISVSTLRRDRFLRKGLPYVKFGRRCLYDVDDCDLYMEKRKVTGTHEKKITPRRPFTFLDGSQG